LIAVIDFDALVFGPVMDIFGCSAGYIIPEGGDATPCRAMINQQRGTEEHDIGRIQRSGHVVEVRASELTPAKGGVFDFGEPMLGFRLWKVVQEPVREDRLKLIWTCAVSPA
jgi:hypothetical protein